MTNQNPTRPEEALLTAKEVAAILRASEWWVLQHASGGRRTLRPTIPAKRLGRMVRFHRSDVERFLHDPEACCE